MEKRISILLVTGIAPRRVSGGLAQNLVDILRPIAKKIFVITGLLADRFGEDTVMTQLKGWEVGDSIPKKILKYLKSQLLICCHMLKILKNVDLVIFYYGAQGHLLPMLIAKIAGKKTLFLMTGRLSTVASRSYRDSHWRIARVAVPKAIRIAEEINLRLADRVGIESPILIKAMDLGRHRNKVVITGGRYIDESLFARNPHSIKDYPVVGYVGRLSAAKGVLALAEAIPLVLAKKTVAFLIVGDGPCAGELEAMFKSNNVSSGVRLIGMVPHDIIGEYFRQMSLFIFPSYSEGLPGVVPEAMACGIPVVSTPVGAIPDLIIHGETGFLISHNSPRCIADGLITALNHPHLNSIAENARTMVQKEFKFHAAVERYRVIINEMGDSQESA